MPLFNFECMECGNIMEKLQKGTDPPEITCSECEGSEFKKLFSACGNRVWLDSKELYNQKIAPDAQRIMDEMKKGKDKHFFDIYGEK